MVLSSRSNKIVAVLLIICVIFVAFAAATEQAHALALTTSLVAVVGAALVACGFTFANSDEMSAVVQKFWGTLSSEDQTSFSDIALSFAGSSSGYLAFKLTKSMISALSSWFSTDVDSTGSVAVDYGGLLSSYSGTKEFLQSNVICTSSNSSNMVSNPLSYGVSFGSLGGYPVNLVGVTWNSSNSSSFPIVALYSEFFKVNSSAFTNISWSGKNACIDIIDCLANGVFLFSPAMTGRSSYLTFEFSFDSFANYSSEYIGTISTTEKGSNSVWSGNLMSNGSTFNLKSVYEFIYTSGANVKTSTDVPCDVVYGPNSATEDKAKTGTDVVVSGKMVQDGALDSDYIGTMTTTGVRDVAAAEAAADSASISGIKDLVQTIATAVTTFFDPTDFSLNFEPIKVGFSDLSDVFPFCIPFDMVDAVKTFAASASDFSFDIKLDTDLLKIDHTVDLTPFKVPILFFRYVAVFWFSWILISRTRDLIKW